MTRRWRVSSVSLFDQQKSSGTDQMLSEGAPNAGVLRSVNSREVPERLFPDWTCPVGADRKLVRIR